MNEDTRVAVCCYAGDGQQVKGNLGLYMHHGCPVTILSPEDSQVEVVHPGVDNRFGGKREYVGPLSLERQYEHLKILLTYPETFFLINDADSACIYPKIPDYLYAEPDVVWSMTARDDDPNRIFDYAFQPPYFLSRGTIEKMLANGPPLAKDIVWNGGGCIDHYMAQLTLHAKLTWKGLQGALGGHFSTNAEHLAVGIQAVKEGFVFIHGAKTHEAWSALIAARKGI